MAAEIALVRQGGLSLRPANDADMDAIAKLPKGQLVLVTIKRPRNPQFHRKFFALLNYGFEHWNPEPEHRGQEVVKSIDRFKAECLILAGYRTVVASMVDGSVRYEPKSISFANMDQAEFERCYKAVFEVIWQRVLSGIQGMDRAQAERVVMEMLAYE